MPSEKNIRVLIADDEKSVRDFLSRFFGLGRIDVTCVETGVAAIEAAQKQKFDLVFLDVRMPGIDGLETYRRLKQTLPDARYVMMTGYAVDEVLEQAKQEGVFACIKKPFEIGQLHMLLE